jgi:hypothetical protein
MLSSAVKLEIRSLICKMMCWWIVIVSFESQLSGPRIPCPKEHQRVKAATTTLKLRDCLGR